MDLNSRSLCRIPFRIPYDLSCVPVQTDRSVQYEIGHVDYRKHQDHSLRDELRLHPNGQDQGHDKTDDTSNVSSLSVRPKLRSQEAEPTS